MGMLVNDKWQESGQPVNYYSHESINPTRIVPLGPLLDLTSAHDRGRFSEGIALRQPR